MPHSQWLARTAPPSRPPDHPRVCVHKSSHTVTWLFSPYPAQLPCCTRMCASASSSHPQRSARTAFPLCSPNLPRVRVHKSSRCAVAQRQASRPEGSVGVMAGQRFYLRLWFARPLVGLRFAHVSPPLSLPALSTSLRALGIAVVVVLVLLPVAPFAVALPTLSTACALATCHLPLVLLG